MIEYTLPQDAMVSLKVYNLLGNEVATLVDVVQRAGVHTVQFEGSNLASSVYFYRLQVAMKSATKKLILLK